MAGNIPGPPVLEKAKPTMRLKGKENEYGETLEFDAFRSRGGNQEDLMDEERWLDFPVHVRIPWEASRYIDNDGDTFLSPTETPGLRTIWNPERVRGLHKQRPRTDTGRNVAFMKIEALLGPPSAVTNVETASGGNEAQE